MYIHINNTYAYLYLFAHTHVHTYIHTYTYVCGLLAGSRGDAEPAREGLKTGSVQNSTNTVQARGPRGLIIPETLGITNKIIQGPSEPW